MSLQPPTDRPAEWADVSGETLGPFKLVEELTRGELASVWRARPLDGEGNALVVKRLHRHHARNPEYRAALEREAELAASFRSPLFVPMLRFEAAPEAYSVMELVEGQNLAALLANARRHDAESTRFALPLLVDALHALDYLHRGHDASGAQSLVHQAPVARHLLVGVDGRARLIDFTLAMGPSTPRAPLCDHRLQPNEMAPEQVLAPSMVDARADIFILGITLWETLTGQRLFDGKNTLEAERRMLSGTIGAPSDASRGVHRAFDRICRRALSRPRGERYATAQEMASELRDEAMRVGVWAEQAEVASWVRSTSALGRTAPRVAPRDYARSEAAQTMMGIGGPSPAVLSIADSYRKAQQSSSGSGRRLRRTSNTPPVRRESTIPIGEGGDAWVAPASRPQPELETPSFAARREPEDAFVAPDFSQLGEGEFDESGYTVTRKSPGLGMIVLAMLGVVAAGMGAYVVRARHNAAAKPQVFSASPEHAPAAEAAPAAWPPPVPPVQVPPVGEVAQPEAVTPPPAPAPVSAPRASEAPARPKEAAPAVARAAAAQEAAAAKVAAAREAAAIKAAKEEPAEPARAPKAAPKANPQRWDVPSTLGAGSKEPPQNGWANPGPSWNAPAPAKDKDKRAPGSAPADLPINPY